MNSIVPPLSFMVVSFGSCWRKLCLLQGPQLSVKHLLGLQSFSLSPANFAQSGGLSCHCIQPPAQPRPLVAGPRICDLTELLGSPFKTQVPLTASRLATQIRKEEAL